METLIVIKINDMKLMETPNVIKWFVL